MAKFSKAEVLYASGLAQQAAESLAIGGDYSEPAAELAAWLEDIVRARDGNALSAFTATLGGPGTPAYAFAWRQLRMICSVFFHKHFTRVLFAIPTGFSSPRELAFPYIECRREIEDSLQSALGLPYLTVRLSAYPCRLSAIEQLGPLELAGFGAELVDYGDSRKIAPSCIVAGEDQLLWLGVYKVVDDSADAMFPAEAPARLSEWRRTAAAVLCAELFRGETPGLVNLAPPLRLPDAMRATRLRQAYTDMMLSVEKVDADRIAVRHSSGRLIWEARKGVVGQGDRGDAWLPEESEVEIQKLLQRVCRLRNVRLEALKP
ncbi:hypothetical protein F6X40_10690 [Paraburkholderia sp. UCT31]|uniref:hypothetical protein n=1 Tax=Paraburkholderia sp. UCT31 TaxID=2615209 RepID=UPI001655BB98|nr:hypothetical protein [Paraburkholderia sp. UCT31]MBC8737275.1 hypothetical protein [Paraburkholderia sp. UCT31]